jgi:mannitol/fructose-specific phosphotransferase system IIA component (Ntr-type)
MTLSGLISPELVCLKVPAASKDKLINKLVSHTCRIDRCAPVPQEELLKTVFMREQIGGTLLPSGLSVPHARLRDFGGFILTLGVPGEALYHEGQAIRMMALMITSQSGTPWYLPVLAALTKISREETFFSPLLQAGSPEEFIRLIRERDLKLD